MLPSMLKPGWSLAPIRCARSDWSKKGRHEEEGGGGWENEGSRATKGKMKYENQERSRRRINNACKLYSYSVFRIHHIPPFQEAQKWPPDPRCSFVYFWRCRHQGNIQTIDCVTLRGIDRGSELRGEMDRVGRERWGTVSRVACLAWLCGRRAVYRESIGFTEADHRRVHFRCGEERKLIG